MILDFTREFTIRTPTRQITPSQGMKMEKQGFLMCLENDCHVIGGNLEILESDISLSYASMFLSTN